MELHPNKMIEAMVRSSFLNVYGEPVDERIKEVRFEDGTVEVEYVDGQIIEFFANLNGVVQ